ncbi:chromosome segregation protein SMC [Peptoniphilus equinus]|uniref:Chromosome partition protein Smc n=1 Tax=Peptoniphilus equinus TaxID=3016343 RepID=A0ABY7QW13_9FIRM|nr:chromosome segregation protein SMC [Peptoniphilus equinus]WBW50621.1 chromosome segregation protein SMC [Peptoniphilus equinus]
MILKTLYIQGFKSFLHKTKIDFNEDITCIVGPNGSGKSNITDAINWVLGENSAKSLRGSRMEDVIFSGTDKRHGTGFAEVTIVFGNDDGAIPLDFKEVQITRRMYRSLESVFMINNVKCRLKDIKELFLDTGIGKDGYSLIGQGQIEGILSSKPEDRRQIFEEAAGVSKYKLRKHESELKLKRTMENLTRLQDIIRELELREDELREASEKALRYLSYQDELKTLEIGLAAQEMEKLNALKDEDEAALLHLNESLALALNTFDTIKQDLEVLKRDEEASRTELDRVAQHSKDVSATLYEQKNALSILELEYKKHQDDLETAYAAATHRQGHIDTLHTDLKQKDEIRGNLETELEAARDELAAVEFELKVKRDDLTKGEATFQSLQAQYVKREQERAALESKISLVEVMAQEKATRRTQLQTTVEKLNSSTIELEQAICDAKVHYKDAGQKRQTLQETQATLETAIRTHEAAGATLQKTLADKTKLYNQQEAHYKALQNLERSYEGYNKSVKSLMQLVESGSFPGIVGPVADNFRVEKTYETAISVALGGALQHVIVDTLQSAKEVIDHLNKHNMGRVTLLPMDTIKGTRPDVTLDGDVIGFAHELIAYNKAYDAIFKNLLGRTLVVKDFNTGAKVLKRYQQRFRVVSLRGDSFNTSGSVTGGSLNKYNQNILSRKNELAELNAQLTRERGALDMLQQDLQDTLTSLKQTQARHSEVSEAIEDIGKSQLKLENRLDVLHTSLKSNQGYWTRYNDELQHLELQIRDDTLSAAKLHDALVELGPQEETAGLSDDLDILKRELERATEQKLECSVALNAVEARLRELDTETTRLSAELEAAYTEETASNAHIVQLKTTLDEEATKLAEAQDHLNILDSNSCDVLEREASLKDALHTLTDTIASKIDVLETVRESRYSLEQDKVKLEGKIERTCDRMQSMMENLYEAYGEVTLIKADARITKTSVQELKQAMQALGQVNVTAPQEYAELSERLNFNRIQQQDLFDAKEEIDEIIQNLEREMKTRFTKTFNKVSKYFSEIFVQLFGGGRATIELEDSTLAGGIEIKAEPPGKKLQSLSLLSGGERALTAVALLFALLKVRPAPFCILDEIDAALDDANIKKYADYLMTLEDIQFIIITHRKLTMEIANVLYGVTMEEEGISKIVAVKLD